MGKGIMLVKGYKLDKFTQGYLVAALWSSVRDDNDAPTDAITDNQAIIDISEPLLKSSIADCAKFQQENAADIELALDYRPLDHLGHDFWLTRAGHGAGFWDRGMGEIGDRLTKACEAYKPIDLFVNAQGEVCA
jgi:hypothetical protein